ncbi:hypothetical protein Sulku_0559 [Sulfuricurvum kujiense DSM 16994]|uniref:Uncharacterized protein n=1 Tax=Sulfuricurvum kujiense (strain ATCC BAA-921 / DSM 16994 / JCM 11577 / YK-1) TaxID=709032 RepID=E4U0C8_SULKY|nr:hypothetical protein [Sulfuricurvum kujiense]ADR33225.1 hypothetical protein Sulku_0559 [Sulfuricurvum kujiense DSM 16994]
MVFYCALFLSFLYFKIARVHKKEERLSPLFLAQHLMTAVAIVSLLAYGFMYENLYVFVPILFVFASMVSMMITAVQVGIFVDGKPLFGLTQIYRYLSVLSIITLLLISSLWITQIAF